MSDIGIKSGSSSSAFDARIRFLLEDCLSCLFPKLSIHCYSVISSDPRCCYLYLSSYLKGEPAGLGVEGRGEPSLDFQNFFTFKYIVFTKQDLHLFCILSNQKRHVLNNEKGLISVL
ncbi:hypothetical protein LINGRAHAP2_LOCUS31511, partial [Linum grandiflorum]